MANQRESLKNKKEKIVVIIGTFKWYDRTANQMPMFNNITHLDLENKTINHIHIKEENMINPETLNKNKTYVIIGKVYEYERRKNKTIDYSLEDVCLIPVDE